MSLIVTNNIVNQKFGIPIPNFFVCSMFKENWSINKITYVYFTFNNLIIALKSEKFSTILA